MGPWQLALLALAGAVAGFLNVLAGGGSLLTLPAMIFLGLPPSTANGTNRIAILAQNGAAVWGFRRRGFSDFGLSLRLSLCGIPGALAGAFVAVRISDAWFQRLLAFVMIGVLLTVLWPKRKAGGRPETTSRHPAGRAGSAAGARSVGAGAGPEAARSPERTVWAYVAMVGIGFYVGFIQAGVGFILMAVLHTLLRLDLVRVNMHKVFLVGIFTLPAFAVFIGKGEVAWLPGIVLAAGNAAGGWLGSKVAVERGERVIRIVFAATVLATAAKLLVP